MKCDFVKKNQGAPYINACTSFDTKQHLKTMI